jgi:hypothetical protein
MASAICQIAFAQNISTVTVNAENINVTPVIDTILLTDPVTGEVHYKKSIRQLPLISYRSGLPIFKDKEASEPVAKAAQESIAAFIKELCAEEFEKSKDYYDIVMVLINENGKVDMLNTNFFIKKSKDSEALHTGMWEKLNNITFIPAKKDGNAVPYLVTFAAPEKNYKK